MPRARPDLDDNRSLWAATRPPLDPLPPLKGDVVVDVAVVGAGFTGLSTAWHLSARHPDLGIAVLEARRVGNGASGRNGGMALNWINGVEWKDEARAKRLFETTLSGIEWIDHVIREHGLDVRFRRGGCLEVYTDARRAEHAHAKAEKLAGWGLPVRWLSGRELAERTAAVGAIGAVLDPTAGQLHGLDLLHGLRPILLGRGVRIFEDTPVLGIDEGAVHVLTTPDGTLRARWLVIATNGYSPRLGYFGTRLFPLMSHVISTEALPAERWRTLGWGDTAGFTDDLDRIAYASMTPDGRMVFGGGGNPAYAYRFGNRTAWTGGDAGYDYVHRKLLRYFPGAADVRIEHRWTGTLGITLSRVCSMGVTGEHRNVLYALGYSGHGVVLANLAGRVLADLYDDHHEPWRDLPFYQRKLGFVPPEPFRWIGYQFYTRLTGRSPRRSEAD